MRRGNSLSSLSGVNSFSLGLNKFGGRKSSVKFNVDKAKEGTLKRRDVSEQTLDGANARSPSQMNSSVQTGKPHKSEWYSSTLAVRVRAALHGKIFSALMVTALFIALFLPQMWVIAGFNSNLEIDIILSMVMVLFTVELLVLSAVDATYFLSFFFAMDLLGTVSMVLDISFLFGTAVTVARTADDAGTVKTLTLFRAARAARVGARAGRLSRVLRLLRFLPFLSGAHNEKAISQRGIAVVISAQLANSVATRVARLTIILVMVIPLFDVLSFPQNDFSLQTWVERLSALNEKQKVRDFERELVEMVQFFSRHNYGPYQACHGYTLETGTFICNEVVANFQPELSEPPRMASALIIHSHNFLVGFNMHGPIVSEACLQAITTLFIIFSMVFSGLALSSVVTELAVRPLERMLLTVRQIASTVFKFSQEVVSEQGSEDEAYDVDSTSEMELLEKVVQKLAIIADLQTRNNVERTEDMRDEDIGILSMMQGKNIVEEAAKQDRRSSVPQIRKKSMAPTMKLEDIGLSQNLYHSWVFNSLLLSKTQKARLAIFTISRFHDPGEGFVRTPEEESTLQRFTQTLEKEYLANPFHNFAHAVDVVHVAARILRLIHSEAYLSDLEQFSLLIAGIAHDVGHPGVNNGFLSEVGHELALQYNDRSPLENMHCAKLYSIVGNAENNVFQKMTREQYKEARKHCIETILHTDMMSHQAMVKDLQMIYQMNSEVFTNRPDPNGSGANIPAEMEVFSQSDVKVLIMNTVLHSADVSNPCRSWEVTQAWAIAILDEYFAQGDQEKMLGIPVQFLNDREKLNKPNSQIGFIEFMIAPFYAAQIRLWPALYEFGDNLVNNNVCWEEMWVKEVCPSDEERQKVRARVEKVKDVMEDAKLRGAPKPGG